MKRFTKKINLVLISGSLILPGCEDSENEFQPRRVELQQQAGQPQQAEQPPLAEQPEQLEQLPQDDQQQQAQQQQQTQQGSGSSAGYNPVYSGGTYTHYYTSRPIFVPHVITYGTPRTSTPSTWSGFSSSGGHHAGGVSSSASVRGGFGGSGHGAIS